MDRLGALALFAKAVETGSFSEAGRQSGLAPSSVSRRIVELEGWVGAALFHRTTRKLNLTEVGRSFYERTRGILLDLEEAKVMAAQLEDHPSGLIRLTIPASMEHHLTAAIGEFQTRWPGVHFALTFTDRVVDMVGEGYDLAVRIGRLEDSTLRAGKIGEARRYLCASPRYLDRVGAPERPEDLAGHNCLIFRTHPGYNVWRFKAGGRTVDVRAFGSFSADNGYALVKCCSGCHGASSCTGMAGRALVSNRRIRRGHAQASTGSGPDAALRRASLPTLRAAQGEGVCGFSREALRQGL